MKNIKVAQFGLGPIGLETLKLAATKPWAEIVGGIDIDPAKIGRDLGELTGVKALRGPVVYSSLEALVAHARPDIIFHTAVSKFKDAYKQIEPMARQGIGVVSSCEELLFPQLREPKLAARLDRVCRRNGARVVGTGVNPGFVMDVLPVCMTGVSREVRAVHVQRVVNASTRREPLQRKIGSGWPPAKFRRLFKEGKAGHAGLKESLALIAHCLNWKVKDIVETGDAVVADHDIRTRFLEVKKGQTCGLHQYAEGKVNGKTCLTLDIKMYLDAKDPHDAIQIDGEPPLDVVINGGVAGDHATVAALVNAAHNLLGAPAGLLLMTDLPVPRMG
jgi:4-hydroxy-tetrahydrodipicolinate reductase